MHKPTYQIFEGLDQQFYFRLLTDDPETVLLSEGYSSKEGVFKGIAGLMQCAQFDRFFARRISENRRYYFVLKNRAGRIIATSELYGSKSSRNCGIMTVRRASQTGNVADLSHACEA